MSTDAPGAEHKPADKPRSRRRRGFLIAAGVAGGAFVVGSWRFYRQRDRLTPPQALRAGDNEAILTGWIKIDFDGRVIVQVPRQEMGQGITTSLPMLVAEELDADPALIGFEQAAVDSFYANATLFGEGVPMRPDDHGWLANMMRTTQSKLGESLGMVVTGGSTSVRDGWLNMRRAGAAARQMLVSAAARRFGVPAQECTVHDGVVAHAASRQKAGFGELAADAAKLPVPQNPPLKNPQAFTLLGQSRERLDIPAKVDGSAQFGLDVRLPDMLYAAIAQSPTFGGSVKSFDDKNARDMRGIKGVYALPATSTSAAAVAVVAEHYWQARKGLNALDIVWDEGPNAAHDSEEQKSRYVDLLGAGKARTYDDAGDPDRFLAEAASVISADYFVPYLAHATMEPLNCTALVTTDKRCEVWVGNQSPTLVKWFAARAAGIDSEHVTVHTPYLGGGFGRRAEVDVVMQAVMLAARMPGAPVQLIWTREEDMRHDVYRPMAAARFRAVAEPGAGITAWHNRIVSQSCTGGITERLLPAAASDAMKDKTTSEGAFDLPYFLPNRRVEHVLTHEPVPVGYWRSVGHSYNAFFTESFIDECARAANADPYAFRRSMLEQSPRHRKVLEVAATQSGWGSPLPDNHGRGIALAESFGSIVAQVAEVEVRGSTVAVKRVVCAIDCGFAVNPDTVAAQMESGIVFALTAALHGDIAVREGRVQQGNFPDYDMVRLADTPHIEVHILESGVEHLGGVGEPGTPPLAPAVCNAIFAATGKRIRSLPIRL